MEMVLIVGRVGIFEVGRRGVFRMAILSKCREIDLNIWFGIKEFLLWTVNVKNMKYTEVFVCEVICLFEL